MTSLISNLKALRDVPLREQLSTLLKASTPIQRPGFPFSMIEGEIPRGALVEVSGALGCGKTEAVLQLLSENPEVRTAWVEENLTLYPVAFQQLRARLERMLFVDASRESELALWSAQQILRSEAFGILVLVAHDLTELALRRLQLAAERVGTTVILLSDQSSHVGNWPMAMQLEVGRVNGRIEARVLKRRGAAVTPLLPSSDSLPSSEPSAALMTRAQA